VAVCASGCFSAAQALIAAKSNVSYVAPAVGPLDDVGSIGMDLVEQIIRVYDNYGFQTQILVCDLRNPVHVLDAALMGADVAAISPAVIEQLFRHPLSDEILASRER
jgi:transaldolase